MHPTEEEDSPWDDAGEAQAPWDGARNGVDNADYNAMTWTGGGAEDACYGEDDEDGGNARVVVWIGGGVRDGVWSDHVKTPAPVGIVVKLEASGVDDGRVTKWVHRCPCWGLSCFHGCDCGHVPRILRGKMNWKVQDPLLNRVVRMVGIDLHWFGAAWVGRKTVVQDVRRSCWKNDDSWYGHGDARDHD